MQIPVETQFARMLAGNEKKLRDKGVQKLREWLAARSSSKEALFSEVEMMKLWKGLFYCMWMSDKPLIQEELSAEISGLIHCFGNTDAALLFIDCFFKTMNREWFGIDQWRLDKFMMFVRKFLNQCFCLVKRLHWEDDVISSLMNVLRNTVIRGQQVTGDLDVGLQLHVADIYVEELAKVAAKSVSGDKLTAFFVPYCHFFAESKLPALLKTIMTRVFEFTIRLSDFDDDSKMNDGDDSEDDDMEDNIEDDDDKFSLDVEAKWKHIVQQHESKAQELPFPNFDYTALGDKLLEIVSKSKHINSYNLEMAHSQVKKLYEIAEGIFPLDVVPGDLSDSDDDNDLINKATNNLITCDEENYVMNQSIKEKNKRAKKRRASLFSEENEFGEKEKEQSVSKRRKKKVAKDEDDGIDSEPHNCDKLMLRLLKKAAKEKKSKKQKETVITDRAEKSQSIKKMKKQRNKRKKTSIEVPEVDGNDVTKEITNDSSEQEQPMAENQGETRDKPSKQPTAENQEEIIDKTLEQPTAENQGEIIDKTSEHYSTEDVKESIEETVVTMRNTSEETLHRHENTNAKHINGPAETEKVIPITLKPIGKLAKSRYFNQVAALELNGGNKRGGSPKKKATPTKSPTVSYKQQLVNYDSFMKSPPAFFKNVVSKISPKSAKKKAGIASKANITNGGERKVNFVLAKNLEHEVKDYAVSVRSSPAIPFDARKLPTQGVLKATALTTPVKTPKRATAKVFF